LFSTAEKTTRHTTAVQQKTAGNTFFRKAAGETAFFGATETPSFFSSTIQPKLTVSSPDDPQEREADAVAENVMRMPEPATAIPEEKEKEKVQRSESENGDSSTAATVIDAPHNTSEEEVINRKEEKEKEEKISPKAEAPIISIQTKEEKEEEKLSPKLFRNIHRSADEYEAAPISDDASAIGDYSINRKDLSLFHSDVIQRSGRGPPAGSMQFEQTLASSKGGGSALPASTQQFMEGRFNADFSGVRIHTGSTAEDLSRTIHAQAFTHGNDIYFNSSKFSPNTADGSTLLAHELTHTIQQGASKNIAPSQNNNTSVAAKPTLQRRQTDISSSGINTTQEHVRSPKDLPHRKRRSPNEQPKSLRDIRKEVFGIDRKEEPNIQDNLHAEHNETGIQPNAEISSWSIRADGKLQTPSTSPTVQPSSTIQVKEEIKENKREDEEKLEPAPQPSIEKKALLGLQHEKQSETVINNSVPHVHNLQLKTDYHDSSSNHEINTSTPVRSSEQDRGPPSTLMVSNSGELVQRSWLGDAWDAVSGAVGEAAAWVERGIDAAKEWILTRIRSFVQNIPGYNILALILQHDPITQEPVERSGRNILLAGLQLIPGGDLFRQVLERVDAINEAGAWIDARISDLLSIVSDIGNRFTQFIDRLSLDDIGNPEGVLDRVAELFRGIFNDVTGFMTRAAVEFLEMIKRIMLRLIVDFVRNQIPRLYPLLRVALGHDPVTGEEVPRNGHNILYAALDATDEGREQRRQMEETGTFDRVAAWIDRGIYVFTTAYELLRQAFTNLWDYVTIENLFSPIETFTRIYNDFAAPISLVGNFLADLALEIVRLIKDALLRRLRDYARTVRGYFLVTVIIGTDPFTHEEVPRTIPNIIHGFMSLMEGGEEQYRQMEESGAIARTTQQIEAAVARLNMTPAYIIQLFIDLWNSFSLNDLAHPIDAFMRIVDRFGEPIGRLIEFVIEIVKIVVHVILEIMNFPFDLINNIITRAMAAFERIKNDPIGFLKNLLRAIKQGFIQFFDHILTHLLNGLTGWLMSELRDANVPAPTDFTLRGMIGWVLQVLGISMEAIWQKLSEHQRVGPQRVARIRSMINTLEGIWTFIKDVQERGMAAIWDKIQEQLSSLVDTVLDAVKNWVMERVISQVTARLMTMLDPTGIMTVINGAMAFYRAIQSFIRYLREMLEVVNSFVNGVADIAEGNVNTAANYLENAMDRAMPIVIGFLANQVGLSGVGRRIAEIIGRVRAMVDRALTWLVNRAVDTGMNLLDRVMVAGRSAVSAVVSWARGIVGLEQPFTTNDGTGHRIYFAQSGDTVRLMINPIPATTFVGAIERIVVPDPPNDKVQVTAKINVPLKRNNAIEERVEVDNGNIGIDELKTKALRVAQHLDGLIISRRRTSAEPSAQAPVQGSLAPGATEQTEDFSSSLSGLSMITKYIMSQLSGGGLLPVTPVPRYGELQNGFGTTMEVNPLTNLGAPGSTVRVSSDVYQDLLRRKRAPGSINTYYVGGHLLNKDVHGSGATWQNIAPLANSSNTAMESNLESNVKTAVLTNNQILHLKVRVTYALPEKTGLLREIEQTAGWNQPGPLLEKHKIIEAEAKLPNKIYASCRQLQHDGTPFPSGTGYNANVNFEEREILNHADFVTQTSLNDYFLLDASVVVYKTLTDLKREAVSDAANETWETFSSKESNRRSINNLSAAERSNILTYFTHLKAFIAEQARIDELEGVSEIQTWNDFIRGYAIYRPISNEPAEFATNRQTLRSNFDTKMTGVKNRFIQQLRDLVNSDGFNPNTKWIDFIRSNGLVARPGILENSEIQDFRTNVFDPRIAQLRSSVHS
jgi:hypothetical protein